MLRTRRGQAPAGLPRSAGDPPARCRARYGGAIAGHTGCAQATAASLLKLTTPCLTPNYRLPYKCASARLLHLLQVFASQLDPQFQQFLRREHSWPACAHSRTCLLESGV